jgi:hypothetical protein
VRCPEHNKNSASSFKKKSLQRTTLLPGLISI